jgi:hypothetical protein
VSTFALLRLPVVVLTVLIYATQSFSDGPALGTRRWLMLATLLNLAMVLPPTVWASLLPSTCVIYIASVPDLLLWAYAASLGVYFMVVRAEFKRNMEVRPTRMRHSPSD